MNRERRLLPAASLRCAAFLALLLSPTGLSRCASTDTTLDLPAGWTDSPAGTVYSMADDVIAVAIFEKGSSFPQKVTRIAQFRGLRGEKKTVVNTDVPGHVSRLDYSNDGTRLLVHHTVPETEGICVTLLDAEGKVLWTRNDSRLHYFSTSGDALFSLVDNEGLGAGPDVTILDLTGKVQRTIAFDDLYESAGVAREGGASHFTLFGSGETGILVGRRSATCFSLGATPRKLWSSDLPDSPATRFARVFALDSQSVVLELGDASFRIIDVASGDVRYVFDPGARAAADSNPAHDVPFWRSFEPGAGPLPGTVTLLNRKGNAYTLNYKTGALWERQLDVSIPEGFVLRDGLNHQRLVFMSGRQIRIRDVAPGRGELDRMAGSSLRKR